MTIDRLASVRRKLAQARLHLDVFENLASHLRADNSHHGRQEYNHQLGQYEFHVDADWLVSDDFPIVAGDLFYNARSALDHLAHALVRRPSKKTGFPIFNTGTSFTCWASPSMKTMKPSAKAKIENLQPYQRPNGLKSLWWLHELNNIDKHRALIVVAVNSAGTAWRGGFPEDVPLFFPTKRLERDAIFLTAKAPFDDQIHHDYLPIGQVVIQNAPAPDWPAGIVLRKILDDIENTLLPAFTASDFP